MPLNLHHILPSKHRLRWLSLALIAGLAMVLLVYALTSDVSHRQDRVLKVGSAVIISLLLLLIWLLFFSQLRWKIRLIGLAAVVLILGFAAALFRVTGFSGDLVPMVEWRWGKGAGEPLVATATTAPEKRSLISNDYPQFLGPDRNATLPGVKLARDWTANPPRLLWRQSIGAGWSAFAVVGDSAITQEQHGDEERVVCYELKSGAFKWSHSDTARFEGIPAGLGPRATPTITQNRVYTLGATGILNCLDFATGAQIWSKDIIKDNRAEPQTWGVSGSPLVFEHFVVVSAGGVKGRSLVAYHTETGERLWSGGNDEAGYSSSQLRTIAGVPQILIFNYFNVVAHHPRTGDLLWQYPWPHGTEVVAQPVPLPGDRVFVSTGYGIGCKLLQIERDNAKNLKATLIWETPRLKAKFSNVVHRDGYIYGLDDGILVCLDLADGQRKWKRGRYGHGQLLLVDDLLLIQAESGDIVLVEANPNEHKELARFPALAGKTWNNPAFAAPYLLVRNDREAACYELTLE